MVGTFTAQVRYLDDILSRERLTNEARKAGASVCSTRSVKLGTTPFHRSRLRAGLWLQQEIAALRPEATLAAMIAMSRCPKPGGGNGS
jgi:hypothetical protein